MADNGAQPHAFVLDNGKSVLKDELDKFALTAKPNTSFKEDPFKEKKYVVKRRYVKNSENKRMAVKSVNTDPSNQVKDHQNLYGLYGLIPPPYPPKMLARLAELNTYHAVSCKTKAVDCGGLGCKIIPYGNNDKRDPAEKEKLEQFLNNCRPTPEDVFTRGFQDEEEIGWLGWELIRVGGLADSEPERLEHISSHTFRVHKDNNRYMMTWDGINNRWFKAIGEYSSVTDRQNKDINNIDGSEHPFGSLPVNLLAHEMIFDLNYSSRSSYYGIPDAVPAIRTIIGDQAATEYNIKFFKNFGVPAYAVFITGNYRDSPLTDDKGEPILGSDGKPQGKLQGIIEKKFRELQRNPHGNLVMMIPSRDADSEVKVTFEPLAVDIKDASFRLYREANRDEIITAHRMDPYRAMITGVGALGGNTAVEMKKNYKSTTIRPKQRRIEALINIHIIWAETGFNIQDWAFKFEELDAEDETAEMNLDKALFSMSALRPIDLIQKWASKAGVTVPEGLSEDKALNAYYLPNNVSPTDTVFSSPVSGANTTNVNVVPPATKNNPAMFEKFADIIEDIAGKLDNEQKGLGDKFRGILNVQ